MNGIVKYLCVVVGIGIVPPLDRDKSGTSAVPPIDVASQLQKWEEPAVAGSFDAERAGFEPAVGFDPYAALAKRCESRDSLGKTSDFAIEPDSGAATGAAGVPKPADSATDAGNLPDAIRQAVSNWTSLSPEVRKAIETLLSHSRDR